MQRLRETSRGLQVTQETDILTFDPHYEDGVRVSLKESALGTSDAMRNFVVEGRDNMRDFGSWLTRLASTEASQAVPSGFNTYTVDPHTSVGAVSIVRQKRGVGLMEFLGGDYEGLGTDTIEDLNAVIDGLSERLLGEERKQRRVEAEAFAYPLGVPEGMTPIILAKQSHDRLAMQFDTVLLFDPVPFEPAQQMGQWVLEGLDVIKKKSVWG